MATRQISIEDHVTCSICMDLYDEPLALPCMHSFCRRCLHGIRTGGGLSLRCPECRTDIQLGMKGVEDLPRNFQLGSIVDSYRKELKEPVRPVSRTSRATYCRQHQAVCQIVCKPCKLDVCVKCIVSSHGRHKLTYPAEGRVDLPEEFDDTVCQQHAKNFKLYCTDCRTPVCIDCIVQQHSTHGFGHIAEMHSQFMNVCATLRRFRPPKEKLSSHYFHLNAGKKIDLRDNELNEHLADLESRKRLVRATQKSCRVLAQKSQADAQKKQQQLTAYFSRVREMVDKREESLRREITSVERQSVDNYLATADRTHKKEKEVDKLIDELRRLGTEDQTHFLKEFMGKQARINRLLSSEDDDAPPRHRCVDDATLMTQTMETELANIRWDWKKEDLKPVRKAPPVPPARPPRKNDSTRSHDHRRQLQTRPELQAGCPVQRGRDWNDGNRDGGPGHFGTVVQITLDPNTYMVRWPNGNTGSYKYEPPYTEEVAPP